MPAKNPITIRPTREDDKTYIREEMRRWWGDEMVVVRGEVYYPAAFDGFIAEYGSEKVGLIILRTGKERCEILSLTTGDNHPHAGKELVNAAIEYANESGMETLVVVTTNDNTQALRFYQQIGFKISAWRKDAVERARQIKPTIPANGNYHIPIRDEIELELTL